MRFKAKMVCVVVYLFRLRTRDHFPDFFTHIDRSQVYFWMFVGKHSKYLIGESLADLVDVLKIKNNPLKQLHAR